MSLQTCILEAKQWADKNDEGQNGKLKLKSGEIEELGKVLQAAYDAGMNPAQRMKLLQDAVELKIQTALNKTLGEKYQNAIQNAKNGSNIVANTKAWSAEGKVEGKQAVAAFKAFMDGKSARPGLGVNQDPMAAYGAAWAQQMKFLRNAMTPDELKLFEPLDKKDPMTADMHQELMMMRDKSRAASTGNDLALSLARGLRKAQDGSFKDVQAVNPYMTENALYLYSRSWNDELVGKTTREDFVAKTLSRYGKALVGTETEKAETIGQMYDDIKSGATPESKETGDSRFWEPKGTSGSKALQNANSRVLIPNDAKAEFDSNAEFGDDLFNSYMKQAQRNAQYIATASKWGTRPAENFETLFNQTAKALTDPAEKKIFIDSKPELFKKFTETTGSKTALNGWGRANQALMGWESLAWTGMHVPKALGANVAAIAQIRSNYGLNFFESLSEYARGTAQLAQKMLPGGDPREAIGELGVMHRSYAQDLAGNVVLGSKGQELGGPSKVMNLLGTLNLADRQNASAKYISADADVRYMGQQAGTSFDQLNPQAKENLQRFDLAGPKWEVLRQAAQDGRLTTDGIRNLSDEAVAPLLGVKKGPQAAYAVKAGLVQDYGTMLNQHASMTVAESNSASRGIAYGLSNPNSDEGIARRLFMQFRQVGIVRGQLLNQVFRSGGGDTSNWGGSIQYALGMAAAGYIGHELTELGAGRELTDPRDLRSISAMLNETGIGGMYGHMLADVLTTAPSKWRDLISADILGPSVGTGLKALTAVGKTGEGVYNELQGRRTSDQWGQAQWARLLHSLTPEQNLFYAKGALDHLFFNGIHQALGDQGYIGLMQKQMRDSHALLHSGPQQFTFGGLSPWFK